MGRRIIYVTNAPFYDEETKRGEETMTRRNAHSTDTATTAESKVTPRRRVGSRIINR